MTTKRALLNVPDASTLRGQHDRAILATLLYHGLRRAELCALRVADIQERRGVEHLQVRGKTAKFVTCSCVQARRGSRRTLMQLVMAMTQTAHCSVQQATTQVAALRRSRLMASIRC